MKIVDNRWVKLLLMLVVAIGLNLAVIAFADFDIKGGLSIQYTVVTNKIDNYQVFYSDTEEWNEEQSIKQDYITPQKEQTFTYILPKNVKNIRLDLGNKEGEVLLSNIFIRYLWKTEDINNKVLDKYNSISDIKSIKQIDDIIHIMSMGKDPNITINLEDSQLGEWLKIDKFMNYSFKILICIGINILLLIFIKRRRVVSGLIRELYCNRALIWNLANNDFKTKYAGSYLGITWAFVQPVVTVLVYWFVFQVGFKSGPIKDFPFVLWLVAGIVPWFFFSEALMNATNSMLEYNYLVKKVVFKISILPIVKITSALFVHAFFIGFTILLFGIYGFFPTLYTIQVVYYTLCMFVFVLGISYATCAIIIFFRDLGQIMTIVLQVGMWMTPIMWSFNMVPSKYQWILKINPMYYIVEGYRDSLINNVWFWERFNQTIYFWLITIGLFAIGSVVFKRLKIHFADVL